MPDECDELRGMERFVCRLKSCVVKVGNVFGFNVFIQNSENHIGSVSGDTEQVTVQIANTADAYDGSTNPVCIGTPVRIPDAMRIIGGKGVHQSIMAKIKNNQKASMIFIIFNQEPLHGQYVNKSAPVFGTDWDNIIRMIQISKSDFISVGEGALADSTVTKIVKAVGSKDLWVQPLLAEALTYNTANVISLQSGYMRD